MSASQLQDLLAQVEQLTLVNNKLKQELCTNSSHIARLESAMLQRRATGSHHEERKCLSIAPTGHVEYVHCLIYRCLYT